MHWCSVLILSGESFAGLNFETQNLFINLSFKSIKT
ncbi:MAG: hypothetical protein H6Q19_1185 [Bacteroidetes bacterium]|nr:hypothetical protein [Bacteroidota bacterium]